MRKLRVILHFLPESPKKYARWPGSSFTFYDPIWIATYRPRLNTRQFQQRAHLKNTEAMWSLSDSQDSKLKQTAM